MSVDVGGIVNDILSEAARIGGNIWDKMRKSAPLYARGYANALADIAIGLAKGEITRSDAKMYTKDARLLLVMGISHTSQILFVQAQNFINKVLARVKDAINAALPIALL